MMVFKSKKGDIFPADKCSWREPQSDGWYRVTLNPGGLYSTFEGKLGYIDKFGMFKECSE